MVFQEMVAYLKFVLGGNATSYQDLDDEKKSNSFNKENKSSESAANSFAFIARLTL